MGIALVIGSHALSAAARRTDVIPKDLLVVGGLGVTIMLALSGYLVTTVLLRERNNQGSISLLRFYVRRGFRLLPAFWVFLLLTTLAMRDIPRGDAFAAAALLTDYLPVDHALAHTWSLSLQEHFYLLWAPALALLGPRRLLWLSAIGIAAAPALRVASYFLLPDMRPHSGYMLHTRYDAVLIGCLIALAQHEAPTHPVIAWMKSRTATTASVVFLLLVSPLLEWWVHGAYLQLAGYSLESLAACLLIVGCTATSSGIPIRLLGAPALVRLGTVSYGLYMWQQLLFDDRVPVTSISAAAVAVAALFGVAFAMRRIVEQPAIAAGAAILSSSVQRPRWNTAKEP